ncbi:hypothetical protein C1H76_7677 [Elsinoe australis]|uniref:Uncharacterized protein n=1 Tax=Elsinoe australis TaxID=40998 RepID=A0A4U7AUS2_9PEZI|nr:hypothetical protein C1H76_7677 [Elsinoe australis]
MLASSTSDVGVDKEHIFLEYVNGIEHAARLVQRSSVGDKNFSFLLNELDYRSHGLLKSVEGRTDSHEHTELQRLACTINEHVAITLTYKVQSPPFAPTKIVDLREFLELAISQPWDTLDDWLLDFLENSISHDLLIQTLINIDGSNRTAAKINVTPTDSSSELLQALRQQHILHVANTSKTLVFLDNKLFLSEQQGKDMETDLYEAKLMVGVWRGLIATDMQASEKRVQAAQLQTSQTHAAMQRAVQERNMAKQAAFKSNAELVSKTAEHDLQLQAREGEASTHASTKASLASVQAALQSTKTALTTTQAQLEVMQYWASKLREKSNSLHVKYEEAKGLLTTAEKQASNRLHALTSSKREYYQEKAAHATTSAALEEEKNTHAATTAKFIKEKCTQTAISAELEKEKTAHASTTTELDQAKSDREWAWQEKEKWHSQHDTLAGNYQAVLIEKGKTEASLRDARALNQRVENTHKADKKKHKQEIEKLKAENDKHKAVQDALGTLSIADIMTFKDGRLRAKEEAARLKGMLAAFGIDEKTGKVGDPNCFSLGSFLALKADNLNLTVENEKIKENERLLDDALWREEQALKEACKGEAEKVLMERAEELTEELVAKDEVIRSKEDEVAMMKAMREGEIHAAQEEKQKLKEEIGAVKLVMEEKDRQLEAKSKHASGSREAECWFSGIGFLALLFLLMVVASNLYQVFVDWYTGRVFTKGRH